ncbi:MAG: hypothetical protein AAGD25_35195 [Cyanobacteria bacterium P01_F01_bin.150]
MHPYKLVACGFHDELEAIATLRQTVPVVYRDADDQVQTVISRIIDVYSANKADYLKLQDETVIRLDHLVSVNDKPVQFSDSSVSCG